MLAKLKKKTKKKIAKSKLSCLLLHLRQNSSAKLLWNCVKFSVYQNQNLGSRIVKYNVERVFAFFGLGNVGLTIAAVSMFK